MNSTERRDYRERIEELEEELLQLKEQSRTDEREGMDISLFPDDMKPPFGDMRIFLLLYEKRGKVVLAQNLIAQKIGSLDPSRAARQAIGRLRKLVKGKYEIENVRGQGYFLR